MTLEKNMSLTSQIRPAATLLLALTVLTGAVYPALVTGVARIAFRDQAPAACSSRTASCAARA
jgi:K+-transporting ATPase c subunit